MVIESTEVVVQYINTLLNLILLVLKLLILLLCGQSTKLCTKGVNIIMQPLLDTLKTGQDGLIQCCEGAAQTVGNWCPNVLANATT